MYKSITIIITTLLIACSSAKPQYTTKENLCQYTGAYYITFTFIPKKAHPMTMGGIGDAFEMGLLKTNNIENFVENFYEQLVYSPLFDLMDSYKESMNCLGYKAKWYNIYSAAEITSNVIEEQKLKLKDGNIVHIRKYRVLGQLDVKYVENFEECIMSSSIELDISKIKSIDKVAILLDKE